MNETPSLDDLSLFVAVAHLGSLSAAARARDVPLPTLSRRMGRLEAQLGRTLFLRGPSGYSLSEDGRALARELDSLPDLERRLSRWSAAQRGPVPVRITAGFWMSRILARELPVASNPIWVPHLLPNNAALDLARREADIGIRNAPPDHPWLARQALAPVTFAVFGHPDATGFVAAPPTVPSQAWVHQNRSDEITLIADDPRICLDLAEAGHGQIVLPTRIGDQVPGFQRRSDIITELTHTSWLVCHNDARHAPPLRAAIKTIAALLGASD